MDHVDKKLKIEDGKENNVAPEAISMEEIIRSGNVMLFAQHHAAQQSAKRPSSSDSIPSYGSHFQSDDPRAKKPWEYRITEVLEMNLEKKKNELDATKKPAVMVKTEGDIPNLCLHSSFFVEGVRIGWPFPVIMPPQRQVSNRNHG